MAIEEWKKIGENLYVGKTTYRARSWNKARRIGGKEGRGFL